MSFKDRVGTYRIVTAGAFLSGLVALDLFLNFFCGDLPLLFYLVLGGVGAGLGGLAKRFLSGRSAVAAVARWTGVLLALFTLCGMMVEFANPVRWDTKCSWSYCGRALGPGLFESPYPVGTPSCRGWSTCVNEYPYSGEQYRRVLGLLREQGCPAP